MLKNHESMTHRHALLIEQSAYIRDALQETLSVHGIDLLSTVSGEAAIEAMDRHRFTAVICNYHLPGMNGLEFFWRTKELLADAVTILTASAGDDYIANAAINSGVDVFLEMPFKIEDLLAYLVNRTPEVNNTMAEFSFLSSVHHYSAALRRQSGSPAMNGGEIPIKKKAVPASRVLFPGGGMFKIIRNSTPVHGSATGRPDLRLIKGRRDREKPEK
jgi:DNA-binding response OmpR family regulator